MIWAKPGETIKAILGSAPADLVGTITQQVENIDGTTYLAPTTDGIVEAEPTVYTAVREAPAEVENGPLFAFVWHDPAAGVRIVEDLWLSYTPPGPDTLALDVTWTPSVASVGALLRARTTGEGDTELGTFTTATRPTAAQVTELIMDAVGEVATQVGKLDQDCHTDLMRAKASTMAKYKAAMLIELSYFPEQVGAKNSAYDQYERLYDKGMGGLVEAVSEACGGTDDGGSATGGSGPLPSGDFTTETLDLGRHTNW